MENSRFKVITGGLLSPRTSENREFLSAYITNTRLMGVTVLHVHIRLSDREYGSRELHQFFYYDAEEYGLETYRSLLNPEPDEIKEVENSMTGGLGGRPVDLKYREAAFLLQRYAEYNSRNRIPLPGSVKEYKYLLDEKVVFTDPALYMIMYKQCVRVESPYEAVNYFLMRVFGRDFYAAKYLTSGNPEMDLFPEFYHATLCKNTINPGAAPDTYVNESLVESDNTYYLAVSEIKLSGLSVSEFRRSDCAKISPYEAAMMMARPEYISVYNFLESVDCFNRHMTPLTEKAMVNEHDGGTIYMMFHADNSHVKNQEYRLNEDVLGIYYVTYAGQLIAAAYSQDEMEILKKDLENAKKKCRFMFSTEYEFPESVLYQFAESEYVYFDAFVKAVVSEKNHSH